MPLARGAERRDLPRNGATMYGSTRKPSTTGLAGVGGSLSMGWGPLYYDAVTLSPALCGTGTPPLACASASRAAQQSRFFWTCFQRILKQRRDRARG
jgi:hypothetical protein